MRNCRILEHFKGILSNLVVLACRSIIEKSIAENYPISINLENDDIPNSKFGETVFSEEMVLENRWKNAGSYFDRQMAGEEGFEMPGTSQGHPWCGVWQTVGCLNHKKHKQSKKVFVRQYQRSCFRSVCRVCYKKWAARQAHAATKRIIKYQKTNERTAHLMKVYVPKLDKDTKKQVINYLKESGCDGGSLVFAPFEKINDSWIYRPAFYVLGFGNVRTSLRPGWGIVHLQDFTKDNEKSMYDTYYDIMLRCGIRKGFHSFVWFGQLSYRNLLLYCKVFFEEEKKDTKNGKFCPECSSKLRLIYHDGQFPTIPPDQRYIGFVRGDGWRLVFEKKRQQTIWEKLIIKSKRALILVPNGAIALAA